MKKILFGITSLTIGGAERVLVDLANRLVSEYDITIYTIYSGGALEKQLDKRVHLISMYDRPFSEFSKLERLEISLRLMYKDKAPEGYDYVVAFLEGPITRLFAKSKEKKIAWIHNDISKVFGKGFKASLKKSKDGKIYKKYDKLVFVSQENLDDFENTYGKDFDTEIIRNYLDYISVIAKSKEMIELPYDKKDVNFVTVCRLSNQKALDRYIRVHARLEKEGVHSKVYIVGDGPERENLEELIKENKVSDSFILVGEKENPYPYIKKADYFCLLSYYEGYGMVVEEAKILDQNIIITDTAAKEGVAEYKKAAVLGNTEEDIYNGLKKVLSGEELKNMEKQESDENKVMKSNERYYNDIIEKVEKLLD